MRTEAAKARIAEIRREALESGAGDVGSYLMWLEDRLYHAICEISPDPPSSSASPVQPSAESSAY